MNSTRRIDTAAIVLRTTVGVMFVAHALLKYFVFTLPGTAQFFASLGLPGALGYATFGAELVGGALLIAGVQTRIVALSLTPIVLGATWAHAGNGWVFTSANVPVSRHAGDRSAGQRRPRRDSRAGSSTVGAAHRGLTQRRPNSAGQTRAIDQ